MVMTMAHMQSETQRGLRLKYIPVQDHRHPGKVQNLPAYNMTDAAMYLGISGTALQNTLKRQKAKGHEIKRYRIGYGQSRYLLLRDLEALQAAREES